MNEGPDMQYLLSPESGIFWICFVFCKNMTFRYYSSAVVHFSVLSLPPFSLVFFSKDTLQTMPRYPKFSGKGFFGKHLDGFKNKFNQTVVLFFTKSSKENIFSDGLLVTI